MRKQIQYSNESLGKISLIPDFLPSPQELSVKKESTKISISLSSESVAYFKEMAKKHNVPYQRIIRELLDNYAQHQMKLDK